MSQVYLNTTPNAHVAGQADPITGNSVQAGNRGTAGDLSGVATSQAQTGGTAPVLSQPTMNPTAMMLALLALNNKIAGEQAGFSEQTAETTRDDIKKAGARRNEQLKTYFDKMSQIKENNTKRCGLFGAIINTFKKMIHGDFKGIAQIWSENIGNILKDVVSLVGAVVMTAVAIGALALSPLSAGATAALGCVCLGCAAAIFIGTVLADPGVQEMIQEALPDEPQWLRMAMGIGLSVTGMVAGIIGGISLTVITGFLTGGVGSIPTLINTVSGVSSAIANIAVAANDMKAGVEKHAQMKIRADADDISADVDVTNARAEELKHALESQTKTFQAVYESMANFMESVRTLIASSSENSRLAASV